MNDYLNPGGLQAKYAGNGSARAGSVDPGADAILAGELRKLGSAQIGTAQGSLNSAIQRLGSLHELLTGSLGNIETSLDRLAGCDAVGVSGTTCPPDEPGELGQLNGVITALFNAAGRIQVQADRLSRI